MKKGTTVADEQHLTWEDIETLKPDPKNPKDHDKVIIRESYERFGFVEVLTMNEKTGLVVAGHGRLEVLIEMKAAGVSAPKRVRVKGGKWLVPVVRGISFKNATEAHAYLVASNRTSELGGWHDDPLAALLASIQASSSLDGIGYNAADLAAMLADNSGGANGSMVGNYGEPPFSVLDTRQGRWREKREAWLALGIESELGRGANLLKFSEQVLKCSFGGTSIFDPVLCELAVRWFSSPGAHVLDPFAGGSVRGIVAAVLGRNYHGIELRGDQVAANEAQWAIVNKKRKSEGTAKWQQGDSSIEVPKLKTEFDFIFSCPPYMDLEVYSEDPADISTMNAGDFERVYRNIIKAAVGKLKQNRFAVWVISEVRDKKTGFFRGFEQLTIEAFEKAGARYYNEAVLINSAASLPMRIKKQWEGARKLGRMHQIVLVFCKGNPQKATEACGKIEGIDWGSVSEDDAPTPTKGGTDPASDFGVVL